MVNPTDGGPAFPSAWHPTTDGYVRGDCGMSLRDYFAAKALPVLVRAFLEPGNAWDSYDDIADSAYLMAEAMVRRHQASTAQSPADTQRAHLKEFGR